MIVTVLNTKNPSSHRSEIRKYTPTHVQYLVNQIKKYSDLPIYCLTDTPTIAEDIPLEDNFEGWWAKLEIFKHFNDALYLDLDTVVMSDITNITNADFKFAGLENVNKPNDFNSGIMRFKGNYKYLYEKFRINPEHYIDKHKNNKSWGDQGYIRDNLGFKPDFIDKHFKIKSATKYMKEKIDKDCLIAFFHGTKKPWDIEKWKKYLE